MDVVHVNVPLRAGKKMKKRKELDALVANSIAKRSCMNGNGTVLNNSNGVNHTNSTVNKRCTTAGNGVSSQDQLLSESTDEQEAYWNSVADGKRGPHHHRSVHHNITARRRRTILSLMRACTALLVFTCVIATITVMWLLIDVREQITSLRSELDQVVASNQGVPEALQKCHSVSRGLQQNQTQLALQLHNFRQQLENITLQVNDIKTGLNQVQQRLKENPDLVNIPQQVRLLSDSVANFGSQMKDVTNTVQSLKEQNSKITSNNADISKNISTLQTTMQRLSMSNNNTTSNVDPKLLLEEKQEIADLRTEVRNNLTLINETLTNYLQWVTTDSHKDHQMIVSLQDTDQSIKARVSSLEVRCDKTLQDQNTSLTMINNLSEQFQKASDKAKTTDTALLTLQAQVRELQTKDVEFNKSLSDLNNILQVEKKSMLPLPSPAVNIPIPQPSTEHDTAAPAMLPTTFLHLLDNSTISSVQQSQSPPLPQQQQVVAENSAPVSKPKTLTTS